MTPREKLEEMGDELWSSIEDKTGAAGDRPKEVFDYVISSFCANIPDDSNLEDVVTRFKEALPRLTTSTCVFLEQIDALNKDVWENIAA